MSRYGTDYEANNLYIAIIEFLENHKLSELLSIVIDAIEVWNLARRRNMTVQELIDQLMQIEDKTIPVKVSDHYNTVNLERVCNWGNCIWLSPERREVEYEDFY